MAGAEEDVGIRQVRWMGAPKATHCSLSAMRPGPSTIRRSCSLLRGDPAADCECSSGAANDECGLHAGLLYGGLGEILQAFEIA